MSELTGKSDRRLPSARRSSRQSAAPRAPRARQAESGQRRNRRVLQLSLVLGIAVGLTVAGLWGVRIWQTFRAGQLESELEVADAEQLPKLIAQLALLDRPGVTVLVGGLRSSRPEVARLSRDKLADLVDSWRTLPAQKSSPLIAHLAESLVAEIDALPAAEQRFAGNLATDFLLWPLDERSVDTTQVVMHCELVLRVGMRAREVAGTATDRTDAPPSPGIRSGLPATTVSQPRPVKDPGFSWSDPLLAGGGLPIDPLDVPALPPQVEDFELDAPSRFIPNSGVQGLPAASPGTPSMFGSTPAQPVRDSTVQPPEANVTPIPDVSWSRLSHIEVLQRLHLSEYEIRSQALRELQRRGFTSELIDIGQQATSPRDADRLELVLSLSKRKDLDPLPWLRHLADDSSREVSRQSLLALTALADPFEARLAKERLQDGESNGPPTRRE